MSGERRSEERAETQDHYRLYERGRLMARARLLKPGFFSNEALCEIVPFGRLLFAGLWTIADREGRMVDSPKWIKAQVFPFDNVPVEKLLSDLEKAGFIQRYGRPDGKRYIQGTKFSEHH